MVWNRFFTGTEVNIIIANLQIDQNAGLPFGGTETWSIPQQAYLQDFWFIPMPTPEGWRREDGTYFTQEQMIDGVVNVNIQESQPNWFPPIGDQ
jgi:hypothetical protein